MAGSGGRAIDRLRLSESLKHQCHVSRRSLTIACIRQILTLTRTKTRKHHQLIAHTVKERHERTVQPADDLLGIVHEIDPCLELNITNTTSGYRQGRNNRLRDPSPADELDGGTRLRNKMGALPSSNAATAPVAWRFSRQHCAPLWNPFWSASAAMLRHSWAASCSRLRRLSSPFAHMVALARHAFV